MNKIKGVEMKKYIVYKSYMFGRNYYNSALQEVPDYSIVDNKIPVVNENELAVLLERNPWLNVEEVND